MALGGAAGKTPSPSRWVSVVASHEASPRRRLGTGEGERGTGVEGKIRPDFLSILTTSRNLSAMGGTYGIHCVLLHSTIPQIQQLKRAHICYHSFRRSGSWGQSNWVLGLGSPKAAVNTSGGTAAPFKAWHPLPHSHQVCRI